MDIPGNDGAPIEARSVPVRGSAVADVEVWEVERVVPDEKVVCEEDAGHGREEDRPAR